MKTLKAFLISSLILHVLFITIEIATLGRLNDHCFMLLICLDIGYFWLLAMILSAKCISFYKIGYFYPTRQLRQKLKEYREAKRNRSYKVDDFPIVLQYYDLWNKLTIPFVITAILPFFVLAFG